MLKILVLEDNERRRAAMLDCVRDRFYQYECIFFDNAKEMCAYLETNLVNALIVSLDHDLDLKVAHNGKLTDCGTGRDVAEFLAAQPPTCPVLIATTNSVAGDGMEFLLREAHWVAHRVHPSGDLEWITTQWFRTLRNAVVASARLREKASTS